MSERRFLCFISGRGSEWHAICTDLDIAVDGDSEQEVRDQLRSAIQTYAEDAMRESEEARRTLMNRRAPWHVTFFWKLRVALSAFRAGHGRGEQFAAFDLPCHV